MIFVSFVNDPLIFHNKFIFILIYITNTVIFFPLFYIFKPSTCPFYYIHFYPYICLLYLFYFPLTQFIQRFSTPNIAYDPLSFAAYNIPLNNTHSPTHFLIHPCFHPSIYRCDGCSFFFFSPSSIKMA